jgi:protein-S-isoprenylcysteine O-methyltransferase Ste14
VASSGGAVAVRAHLLGIRGAFAWTSNAMYAIVFLGLWAIALYTGSWAALAAALFQHAYIWVHYYCTEEPDMELIYGNA